VFGTWMAVVLVSIVSVSPRCDTGTLLSRSADAPVALLVVSTGQTKMVPVPSGPYFSELTETEVLAHRFEVIEVFGNERSVEDEILIVPWAYDGGCFSVLWGSREWVPRGDTAVFLHSEEDRLGTEGIKHALGWHSPYPHADFLAHSGQREDRGDWLTVREYFALLKALPIQEGGTTRKERLEVMEDVFRQGPPAWSEKFPGTEILRRARSWATGQGN
jgi:hypothetical protein